MKNKTEIIVISESFTKSILIKFVTFGLLAFCAYVNNKYCGNSWFLNGIVLLALLSTIYKTAVKHTYTINEAYEKIKQMKKDK